MVCKDGMIAEVPRTLGVKGAEIIFWLTNCGWAEEIEAKYYAYSNKLIIVASNRSDGFAKGGGSVIIDWSGKVIIQANEEECLIIAEIDLSDMNKDREYHWNYDRKPRPELYSALSNPKEQ